MSRIYLQKQGGMEMEMETEMDRAGTILPTRQNIIPLSVTKKRNRLEI